MRVDKQPDGVKIGGKFKEDVLISEIILSKKNEFSYDEILKDMSDIGIESNRSIQETLDHLLEDKSIISNNGKYRVCLHSKQKTAEEMFKNLGFIHEYVMGGFGYIGHEYIYKEKNTGALKVFMFMELTKELRIDNKTDSDIKPKEIEAVVQQMKELGWMQ